MVGRREILRGALGAAAGLAAWSLGPWPRGAWPRGTWAWAADAGASGAAEVGGASGAAEDGDPPALVVVFLRGAVDGLGVVVPYAEARYHELRPTLALPPPGREGGVLDLDGRFGLHPSLAPLLPLFRGERLAFVHATGSPDPTRSHFDAQDYMETGTPGDKTTRDGWLNRGLGLLGGGKGTFDGVAISPMQPAIARGALPVLCIPDLGALRLHGGAASGLRFERMYAEAVRSVLGKAGQEAFTALSEAQKGRLAAVRPGPGAVYPRGQVGRAFADIARLLKAGVGTRLAFTDIGGWDTHNRQAPVLDRRLRELAAALAAFAADLGPALDRTAIVVMSEFGRTVAENGTGGTDHGHGNVAWVLGAGTRGGRVYGRWPGLGEADLFEGRDLAVTTDFRDVVGEVWQAQFGPAGPVLFPGHSAGPGPGLFA